MVEAKWKKVLQACKWAVVGLVLAAGLYLWLGSSSVFAEVDTESWNEFMGQFIQVYNKIVMPTLTTVGTMVLMVAGVANFLKLRHATDDGEREKAKKAIIWWIIAVVGIVAVLWATPNLIGLAQGWFNTTGVN